MVSSQDFRCGKLIKYRFYKAGDSPNSMTRNYWGVGYVVKIAPEYIKFSSLDPNKEKRGVLFEFHKKIKLEDILEFTEIPEPENKKD